MKHSIIHVKKLLVTKMELKILKSSLFKRVISAKETKANEFNVFHITSLLFRSNTIILYFNSYLCYTYA